jgi:hypothetical protein
MRQIGQAKANFGDRRTLTESANDDRQRLGQDIGERGFARKLRGKRELLVRRIKLRV